MSDFVPRDVLVEMWKLILHKHWAYLETEECIEKLENRKKLEDCLKEFLCMIQHERKFILKETVRVLEKSVRDLENFSAQKGITAFESISQYANNLFRKPWRKEFRVLKLYSGYYQHEIKSNLLDAEILFEAMGYRRLTEDTLVLDGPICPDQVANVSRDAMTAYVELQIIKHIYTGLDSIGISSTWLDIYRYRENSIGGTSQAIKALVNSFEEKRFRSRQKLLTGDNYGYIDVQPSSNYYSSNSQFCPAECQCSTYQLGHQMLRQRPVAHTNGVCCLPERQKPSSTATNLVCSNMSYPDQLHNQYNHQNHNPGILTENGGGFLSHMPHSRSLDHYSETTNHYNNILPHRHSFDHHQQQGCTAHYHQCHNLQQQKPQQHYYQHINKVQHNFYESPYACIDGNSLGGDSSNISYAAVAANAGPGGASVNCSFNHPNSTYSHSYNVSGNRVPLPVNISNQLSYENPPASKYNDIQEPTYAHISDENVYSLTSKLPQSFAKSSSIYNHTNSKSLSQNNRNSLAANDFHLQRQHSCQSEQLIDFDDAPTVPNSTLQHQFDPIYQLHPNYDTFNHIMDKHYNMRNTREISVPLSATSVVGRQNCVPANDETYGYAKPIPRESRNKSNASTLRKYAYNNGEITDISSYDSPNDDLGNHQGIENERNHQSFTTQSGKNQDGVGSVELWSNVYQNVEKKEYAKEPGERTDLLVQSLDLDSININSDTAASQSSSTEKRKSFYSGNENKIAQLHEQQQQQQQQMDVKSKSKIFENAKHLTKNNAKPEKACSSSSTTNNIQKQKTLLDNNTKKIKPAPKQTNLTSKPNTSINKSQSKTNDNKSLTKSMNNNNNNDLVDNSRKGNISSGSSSTQHKKSSTLAGSTTKRTPSSSAASTQIIVTGANEWSCHFCTFINKPESNGVCEMCCHSKGFKMDSSSSTAAGTTTIAQNTPTCA